MPNFLYLDIETIPASDPAVIAEIATAVKPPAAMKKADTIAEWEATKKAEAVADAVARTSFDGAYGQVCCIGWAWDDAEPSAFFMDGALTERAALSAFALQIAATRPSNEMPVIVGHYVADFDLRFLWQRAFVLGVAMPAWWPKDPKPWSKEVHDTMHMWAGSKGSISLDNLCGALGLPGKGNIDGSAVAGMFQRGEYNDIATYCMSDVERVRQVHRKMMVALGEVA